MSVERKRIQEIQARNDTNGDIELCAHEAIESFPHDVFALSILFLYILVCKR